MAEVQSEKDGLILAVNSGSSSLKFGLYQMDAKGEERAVLSGGADGIGRSSGSLKIKDASGKSLVERDGVLKTQREALRAIDEEIRTHLHASPAAVGHRVVHGGPKLIAHQRITPAVLEQLRAAVHFAPLHIPEALKLIDEAEKTFPSATQIVCFDDAFHQTMPEVAAHLALPRKYFEAGVRKYGFHGLSYESLVHILGTRLPDRAIFAHLGNGASLCAVRAGKSVDTTMGMTPTGGIPMGTRTGDLDPGVFLYLMRTEKTDVDALETLVNHQSGLLALSDGESDVKALLERGKNGDAKARLALDAFSTAVRKVIGAYAALLGGVDLLVFTGGIGEHSEEIRSAATNGLEFMGITPEKIQVVVTEEEKTIARHCRRLMA